MTQLVSYKSSFKPPDLENGGVLKMHTVGRGSTPICEDIILVLPRNFVL